MRPFGYRLCTIVFAGFVAVVGFGGCSGSGTSLHCLAGDPFCGSVLYTFALSADPSWQPQTPVPIGASATIHFFEQTCVGTGSQSGPPPGVKLGCGKPFPPDALAVTIRNISGPGNGKPCPASADVSGKGAITVTRTGPGDPQQFALSGVSGFCTADVTDPSKPAGGGLPGHPTTQFIF